MSRSGSPADDAYVQLPSETDAKDLSTRVVELISDVRGRPATELPVLMERVDSEALDRLLRRAADDARIEVTFRYAGMTVAVDGNGRIRARERPE